MSPLLRNIVAAAVVVSASAVHAEPQPLGKLVDIGGRRLHIHCTGAGGPTVILESGASSFSIDWTFVQPEMAKTNRVCSYDRAGHAWSEPGRPETPQNATADLRALLAAGGERACEKMRRLNAELAEHAEKSLALSISSLRVPRSLR